MKAASAKLTTPEINGSRLRIEFKVAPRRQLSRTGEQAQDYGENDDEQDDKPDGNQRQDNRDRLFVNRRVLAFGRRGIIFVGHSVYVLLLFIVRTATAIVSSTRTKNSL